MEMVDEASQSAKPVAEILQPGPRAERLCGASKSFNYRYMTHTCSVFLLVSLYRSSAYIWATNLIIYERSAPS